MTERAPGDTAPTVSICINNYNYAGYVGRAVESALAQTYRPLEVLVVDDGSTDDSLEVLRGFGDRIRVVEKPNGGQLSAINTSFAEATGDVVLFLDADDLLEPRAVEGVVAALRPESAKVQFRLRVIDADDNPLGVFPHRLLPLDSGDVTGWLCSEGDYVGPVSSGNAYTRRALEAIMPFEGGTYATRQDGAGSDGYLNSLSPFYGTVESIDEPLGSYRTHGGNQSAASGQVSLDFIRWRIDHEMGRAAEIERHAARHGRTVSEQLMCANPEHVLLRLISLRTDPSRHPVSGDSTALLLRHALTRGRRSHVTPRSRRILIVTACVAAAVLPRRALPGIAQRTLASAPRPAVLRAIATLLSR